MYVVSWVPLNGALSKDLATDWPCSFIGCVVRRYAQGFYLLRRRQKSSLDDQGRFHTGVR